MYIYHCRFLPKMICRDQHHLIMNNCSIWTAPSMTLWRWRRRTFFLTNQSVFWSSPQLLFSVCLLCVVTATSMGRLKAFRGTGLNFLSGCSTSKRPHCQSVLGGCPIKRWPHTTRLCSWCCGLSESTTRRYVRGCPAPAPSSNWRRSSATSRQIYIPHFQCLG